ncbi:MAG: tetratricopeptide repeat protein [Bacteroidota bacterium]
MEDRDTRFHALYLRASVELSLHDFAKALETGKQAQALYPRNAGVYGILVDACVEMGDYAQAVTYSDQMVSIRPDLRSYSRVSYLRELHGQVDGAMEAMQMAIGAGMPGLEQTAWCRQQLAEMMQRYGDLDGAAQQYKMLLVEREDYPFALAGLGDIALEKGDFKAAEKHLTEAIARIPEVGFYVSMAHLYEKTGRTEEAAKTYAEIQTMMAEDSDAGHNMDLELAEVHLELGKDLEKALTYAQKAYSARPDNIDVNAMMARISLAKGEKAAARKYFEVASRTGSKNPVLAEMAAKI